MTKDRIQLNRIKTEIDILQEQYDKIIRHPCGKTYSHIVRDLIYKYIDKGYTDQRHYCMTPAIYLKYQKLRQEISTVTKTKTQTLTKEEYNIVLNYMQLKWNYTVPDEYLSEE